MQILIFAEYITSHPQMSPTGVAELKIQTL